LRNAIQSVVEWRFHALSFSYLKRVVRSVGVFGASTDQDMKALAIKVQLFERHCACPLAALVLPAGVGFVPFGFCEAHS
jgi:hypothetical protein